MGAAAQPGEVERLGRHLLPPAVAVAGAVDDHDRPRPVGGLRTASA
ncbi:MAG: hypothetical protein AVDCRST_MAG36-917 [uncultured Nocardioidaceae bacterium]|uniref:Uncharacterized protein n=1 Tax=uncultured Nocardioidaceae bacterium TaxID=253824 RepID=A0A6J4LF52_9ACTN|nr:MAG: hypothetical protein AVDCRST_MAG36-917 [uncultured Nocardioidaceae bacterium]